MNWRLGTRALPAAAARFASSHRAQLLALLAPAAQLAAVVCEGVFVHRCVHPPPPPANLIFKDPVETPIELHGAHFLILHYPY